MQEILHNIQKHCFTTLFQSRSRHTTLMDADEPTIMHGSCCSALLRQQYLPLDRHRVVIFTFTIPWFSFLGFSHYGHRIIGGKRRPMVRDEDWLFPSQPDRVLNYTSTITVLLSPPSRRRDATRNQLLAVLLHQLS